MSQPTEAQADIVERLTAMYSHRGDGLPTQYVNPDGREAAAEITRLRAQVKIVQSAAKTIMIGEADELRRLREQHREWHLAIKSLDSEREANAILTAENEALRSNPETGHD